MKRQAMIVAPLLAMVGLSACAIVKRGDMRVVLSSDELRAILMRLPGITGGTEIDMFDGAYVALPLERISELYGEAPNPAVLYSSAFDCDKFARMSALNVDLAWARTGAQLPIAHGVLWGVVPADGDNRDTTGHMLNWFVDSDRQVHLRGSMERRILPDWSLANIKEIYGIMTG